MPSGTGTFPSRGDVASPVRCTVTVPAGGGTVLKVQTDAGTTTLNTALGAGGPMVAGKVVVIDGTDPANLIVTYDGTAHFDWFDRSGQWPALGAGDTTVTALVGSTPAAIDVLWSPCLMGLVV